MFFSLFLSSLLQEVSKNVPKVISYLIDHCPDLFGESVLTLLGPELEPARPDSGAEVSDSSCNSLSDSTTAVKTLTDITSAESDRKNKTSLSNLSRDSGLTASDTQLYSPADQEDPDSAPEEEKMFSLPAATSLPAVLFERKKSTSPITGLLAGRKNSHKNLLNNNTTLVNNNSHKCVNRVLSTSIPHLNTDELESMLNGTFSYGKSVGIGLNGSCQDVVRNRKRHQVLQSTPVPPHVSPYDGHQQQSPQSLTTTTPLRIPVSKCRSPMASMENRLPSAPSVNNLYNYQHHSHQLQHPNLGVNRFFSKSVPHLNLIGFRNSVTFSPSPRRATRVNLHAWSYDVSHAQHRHNQSLPNHEDHYQSPHMHQQPGSQGEGDKCMFRCRATPFISYGSHQQRQQQASPLTPCYTPSRGVTAGHNNVTVNGKRLQTLHPMSSSSKKSLSPFGSVCPPSYQETMDRKKFAARLQSNVSLFRKISFDGVYEQFELRL